VREEDGRRAWATYDDLEMDEGDFDDIGEAFAATGAEQSGPVGAGTGRRCRMRELVDFAVVWMERHRPHPEG
jgi:aminoglycoside 3-N-acetyltransferase